MHLEEVGDGQRVGFCYDRWYGNHALKEVYPKLFSIVVNKDALAHSHVETSVEGGKGWNIRLVWALNDWDLKFAYSLFDAIYSNIQRD